MIDYMLDSPPHTEPDEEMLSVEDTISVLHNYQTTWANTPFEERKRILLACADNLEEEITSAANRLVHHAFKTYPNAVAEIRETVDFIRYYADQAELLYHRHVRQGYTGEHNSTEYHARGTWMVISLELSVCNFCWTHQVPHC